MKQTFLLLFALFSLIANAQKDVTKFLGIPVDGTKAEMKTKLINKGFTYDAQLDNFSGEFNGRAVDVYIGTNNNKVWRIMVCDKNWSNETDIKIRFNNLCRQFSKNQRYVPANFGEKEYTLSPDERISYEINVNKKRYEASFYQIPDPALIDTIAIKNQVKESLLSYYTQEELDNPTDIKSEEIEKKARDIALDITLDVMEKKFVWFMIQNKNGEYFITMFYDNEYNHSDGEDL